MKIFILLISLIVIPTLAQSSVQPNGHKEYKKTITKHPHVNTKFKRDIDRKLKVLGHNKLRITLTVTDKCVVEVALPPNVDPRIVGDIAREELVKCIINGTQVQTSQPRRSKPKKKEWKINL